MTGRFRLGVDTGGTFTDATLVNEATGEIQIAKVASTPTDPADAFLQVTQRILRQMEVAPEAVAYVVHGTTVATNAIIEGRVAKAAFLTSGGFRDMLEIARQKRPSLYDLQFEKPSPLIPRDRCFGVPERLTASGQVITPLSEEALHEIALCLRETGVESVAVCFLHSYVDARHEMRAAEVLQATLPTVAVSLSAEVAPEFREYFRASTTVINACVQPIVAQYLGRIDERLRDSGFEAELLVMQSSGGVYTFAAAREKPVFMVESGPAAGVIAATHLGTALGYKDLISFDMGGTTAKVSLVQDGLPRVTKDYEVGGTAQATGGGSKAGGYPIRTPVIDLVEIGAGGGSIAWIDSGGSLRVGPHSAGATPGPACYDRGGTEPTVTDANVVLGRLNPNFFLGGEIQLDVERAHHAIQVRCAERLGMNVTEVAHGIVEIANAAMTNALRLVSVQRGYDPRDFALMAFGGAGPVHANRLATEAEIPVTIVPMSPGTTSALGLLVTDLQHDYSTTIMQRVDHLDMAAVEDAYRTLEHQGRVALAQEGIRSEDVRLMRQVDMRYVGQSYELTIPLQNSFVSAGALDEILDQFHRAHAQAYGYSAPDEPTELVNLRLIATGIIDKPTLRRLTNDALHESSAQKASRPVYFAEAGGTVDCPIYDRYLLAASATIVGPAVVEEIDSTTVIHPGYQADVDQYGNLILTRFPELDGDDPRETAASARP